MSLRVYRIEREDLCDVYLTALLISASLLSFCGTGYLIMHAVNRGSANKTSIVHIEVTANEAATSSAPMDATGAKDATTAGGVTVGDLTMVDA